MAGLVFAVAPEKVDREMRQQAKVINFGILYGMGVNALRAQLGSTTAEAHQYLEDYFTTFKTLSEYLESTKGFARKHGYTETLFGRRRQFPEMKSSLPYVRAQAERMAINAPIQGTEADVLKIAMKRIDDHIRSEGLEKDMRLLLQVHDELVYEVKEEVVLETMNHFKKIMEEIIPEQASAGVPVVSEAHAGDNWVEMKG